MRQAYDYWQDQPGSLRSAECRDGKPTNPGIRRTHKTRRPNRTRRRARERTIDAPRRNGDLPVVLSYRTIHTQKSGIELRRHPRRRTPTRAHGRTFPVQPEAGRPIQDSQLQATEQASTRDTIAQRRRRISIDAISQGVRPTLRKHEHSSKTRTNRGATANRRSGRDASPATPSQGKVAKPAPRAAL